MLSFSLNTACLVLCLCLKVIHLCLRVENWRTEDQYWYSNYGKMVSYMLLLLNSTTELPCITQTTNTSLLCSVPAAGTECSFPNLASLLSPQARSIYSTESVGHWILNLLSSSCSTGPIINPIIPTIRKCHCVEVIEWVNELGHMRGRYLYWK